MQAISRQRWLWRRALLLLVAVTLIVPAFFFTDTAHAASGSMATARAQHTATMLSSGKVLVAGGFNTDIVLASAELFSVQEITVTAQNITAIEGNVFSGTVATGTFTGISGPFSAAITWGDGTSSTGTVTITGSGTFSVTGSHTYADEGSFPLTVLASDNNGHSATSSSTATVSDAALTLTSMSVTPVGARTVILQAAFSDANPISPVSDFSTSTINWGDGVTTTANIIKSAGTGNFTVVATTHVYPSTGSFLVTLTIRGDGGRQVVGTRIVIVS